MRFRVTASAVAKDALTSFKPVAFDSIGKREQLQLSLASRRMDRTWRPRVHIAKMRSRHAA